MYLVRNSEHSMTEPSHLWRDRNGDEMDPTDEELDRYLPDEPTIA